jgi:hypothetical protein
MEKTFSQQMAETLSYFVENPKNNRCSFNGDCSYNPCGESLSKGCFVGVLIDDTELKHEMDDMGTDANGLADEKSILDRLPTIVSENLDVMQSFQTLHDCEPYWSKTKEDYRKSLRT